MKHLIIALLLLLSLINCQLIVQKWNKTQTKADQELNYEQKMLDSFFKEGSSLFFKKVIRDDNFHLYVVLANGHQKNLTKHLLLKVEFKGYNYKHMFGEQRIKQIKRSQNNRIELHFIDDLFDGADDSHQFNVVSAVLHANIIYINDEKLTFLYNSQTINIFIKNVQLETSLPIDGLEITISFIIIIPLCIYLLSKGQKYYGFDILQILGLALTVNSIIYSIMALNTHFQWSLLQQIQTVILIIFCVFGLIGNLIHIIKYSNRIDHLKLKVTIFIITTIHFDSYSLLLNFIFGLATKILHPQDHSIRIFRTVFLFLLFIPLIALKHLQERYLMYNEYYFFKLGFSQQSITNTTIWILLAICLQQTSQTGLIRLAGCMKQKVVNMFLIIKQVTKKLQISQKQIEWKNTDQ